MSTTDPVVYRGNFTAAKAWMAAAFLVMTTLTGIFADDVFSMSEVATLITTGIEAGVGVFAVYQVRNKPKN